MKHSGQYQAFAPTARHPVFARKADLFSISLLLNIAAAISIEIAKQGRTPRLYVQVNTGSEAQKAGIDPREAVAFVSRCRDIHGLSVFSKTLQPRMN